MSGRRVTLGEVTSFVGRGITPRYTSDRYAIVVVNQKCIRDGSVSLEFARKTEQIGSLKYLKYIQTGDILVNSTGVGTLGRTAWWPGLDRMQITCDSHVTIVRPDSRFVFSRFLGYVLRYSEPRIENCAIGSTGQTELGREQLAGLEVSIPPLPEQRAIAEVLGVLDDKIATNTRVATQLDLLAKAKFEQALVTRSIEQPLSELANLVSRGVAPAYSDSADTVTVLNQKCIRDQAVSLAPARKTLRVRVREEKLLRPSDVLVNSTGQGTLGRLARWTSSLEVTADSHISIVRFDESAVDPICAGYGMLRLQPLIEQMGEGSTGQTELSRVELGKIHVRIPDRALQLDLGRQLDTLSALQDARRVESVTLAATRDALLPQLMSGKLRVKDAEKAVEEVL